MYSWNLSVDLPHHVPTSFAYQIIVGLLDRETLIVNDGAITFDFCTGYAPDCELKEYCPCLKIWNEETDDDGNTDSEGEALSF